MASVVKGSGVYNPFSNASEELCVHVCSCVVVRVHGVGGEEACQGEVQTTKQRCKILERVKAGVRAHGGSTCCSNSYSFSVGLKVFPNEGL